MSSEKRREKLLQQLQASRPPAVDWIPAAADFLAVGRNYEYLDEAQRLLAADELAEFWIDADAAFATMQSELRGVARTSLPSDPLYLRDLHAFRRSLVMYLAFHGGPIPLADARPRLRSLAADIRKLRTKVGGACRPAGTTHALERIIDRFERGALGIANPLARSAALQEHPLMPQLGRDNPRRILLERMLCQYFEIHTGTPQYKLVALAVSTTLKTEVDAEDVGARWRNFRSRLA